MPRKCIGIDIGRSHLHAVQIARTPTGFCLEKAFGLPTRRSTDALPDILLALTRDHGFDRRADVAVSLPHRAFFFADIEINEAGLAQLGTGDVSGLKDHFPIPAEDIVAQVCSVLRFADTKDSALIAATSCPVLREQLRLLGEGRMKPARVDTPITAAHATVLLNYPESARGIALVLCADESTLSLAVTHDGKILLVRNIPMQLAPQESLESFARQTAEVVAQEIEITWKRLFDAAPDAGLRVFLLASGQMAEGLVSSLREKTPGQVILVDAYRRIVRAAGVKPDFPIAVAAGLAVGALGPDQAGRINFLTPYNIRTQPHMRLKREAVICAGLAAAAAVVWAIGLFLQLSSLEADYARVKSQAVEIFHRAVPEEKNVVDPAAQLRQKLDSFRRDAEMFACFRPDRTAPLEILQALSQRTPARGGFRLHDVLITGGSVRIMGSCDSFATLSEWQQVLATTPGLQVVNVPNPRKDPQSGQVLFTISLSSTRSKAP
jgi:hypothetical protein